MKGLKVKVNMDVVNCVLLVVILALVVYCLVKQNERFQDSTTAAGNSNNNDNDNNGGNNPVGNNVRALHKRLHNEMNAADDMEEGGQ